MQTYKSEQGNQYMPQNTAQSQQPCQSQGQCPSGCCDGTEILCISIPCPITIVLLGLTLQLELPCLRLTSEDMLTSSQVQQQLQVLSNLLGSLFSGVAAQNVSQQATIQSTAQQSTRKA